MSSTANSIFHRLAASVRDSAEVLWFHTTMASDRPLTNNQRDRIRSMIRVCQATSKAA